MIIAELTTVLLSNVDVTPWTLVIIARAVPLERDWRAFLMRSLKGTSSSAARPLVKGNGLVTAAPTYGADITCEIAAAGTFPIIPGDCAITATF